MKEQQTTYQRQTSHKIPLQSPKTPNCKLERRLQEKTRNCSVLLDAPGRVSESNPSMSATRINWHGPIERCCATADSHQALLLSWLELVTKRHGCHGSLLSPAGSPALSNIKLTGLMMSKSLDTNESSKVRRCFSTAAACVCAWGKGICRCPACFGDKASRAWKAWVQACR